MISLTPLYILSIAALFLCSIVSPSESLNQNIPVIGIITTPRSSRILDRSFIKTGNAEFIEAGGAFVIPIPWDVEEEKFRVLLESVNGIFIQGGTSLLWEEDEVTGTRKYNAFSKRLKYAVDLVIEKNKQGVYYPLLATCLGFEAVSIILTEDFYVLDKYVHSGKLDRIHFTQAAKGSTIFRYFTEKTFEYLENHKTMYFSHQYALNMSVPNLYEALSPEKWRITGLSKDDNDKKFIAAMESKEYPIFMVMYHAEKILWDANHDSNSYHNPIAVESTKLMVRSFVSEAAKNINSLENNLLINELSIKNFPVRDFGDKGLYYVFNQTSLDEKWNLATKSVGVRTNMIFWMILILTIFAVIGFLSFFNSGKDSKTK